MPAPKKDELEVKKPMSVGIRCKTIIAFDAKLEELGLNRSVVIESLIENFLNDKI